MTVLYHWICALTVVVPVGGLWCMECCSQRMRERGVRPSELGHQGEEGEGRIVPVAVTTTEQCLKSSPSQGLWKGQIQVIRPGKWGGSGSVCCMYARPL